MPRKKYPTPPIDEIHPNPRAASLTEIIHSAVDRFEGSFDELEKAIGVLMIGDYVGWKVLVLIHSKSTIRKYENILDINFREFFPPETTISERSNGYRIAMQLGKFWKVVSGDEAVEDRRLFK